MCVYFFEYSHWGFSQNSDDTIRTLIPITFTIITFSLVFLHYSPTFCAASASDSLLFIFLGSYPIHSFCSCCTRFFLQPDSTYSTSSCSVCLFGNEEHPPVLLTATLYFRMNYKQNKHLLFFRKICLLTGDRVDT